MKYISKVLVIIIIVVFTNNCFSQDNQEPLKKLYDQNGLLVQFIYYSEGNGVYNNGIVIFLTNKNEVDITYNFNLVFRTTLIDKTERVSGYLIAGEKKVGSNEGLYFIPFKDGQSITAVGINRCTVEKHSKNTSNID
jgi:hypothetical protein